MCSVPPDTRATSLEEHELTLKCLEKNESIESSLYWSPTTLSSKIAWKPNRIEQFIISLWLVQGVHCPARTGFSPMGIQWYQDKDGWMYWLIVLFLVFSDFQSFSLSFPQQRALLDRVSEAVILNTWVAEDGAVICLYNVLTEAWTGGAAPLKASFLSTSIISCSNYHQVWAHQTV